MQASSIMTSPVIGVEPSASIADAAGLMLSRKISGLPVIRSDGVLVGIVSEGDFLRRGELGTKRKRSRWLEFLVSPGRVAEEYVHANGRRVDEVMSEQVVTTSPESALEDVVELMTRHQVKRIPVVEGGKVIASSHVPIFCAHCFALFQRATRRWQPTNRFVRKSLRSLRRSHGLEQT